MLFKIQQVLLRFINSQIVGRLLHIFVRLINWFKNGCNITLSVYGRLMLIRLLLFILGYIVYQHHNPLTGPSLSILFFSALRMRCGLRSASPSGERLYIK